MQVLSLSSTLSSRRGSRCPKNDQETMMALPDVRQRGRSNRIAMRRWSSRTKMMNPLLFPRVSSCVLIFWPVLNPHIHSPLNNTASLCTATLTDDVLSAMFQQCVPSFRYIRCPVPTNPWIRHRGLQSVQLSASPTPNAAGQPVKLAQIFYETPQLAAIAKENLDEFNLKKGWVMSVSYI